MEEIMNEFGIGILEIFGFAAIFAVFISCIRSNGLIYDYAQIFMNSITG